MEIPENLKQLYRHWEFHTSNSNLTENTLELNAEILERVIAFAGKRMQVWEKKVSSAPLPYSNDPILKDYRFCNIYRELDRQTIQIHELLNPIREEFDLWLLNLAFNRFLCNPETFSKVGFLNFDDKNNKEVFEKLLNLRSPKYGSAYIFPISTIQKSKYDTREKFFTLYLPKVIKEVAAHIRKFERSSVTDALKVILPTFGFNLKFHWTEILIDVAYQFPKHIDLFKEFPIGPGSIPTMKMLSKSDPEKTLMQLVKVNPESFSYLQYEGKNVYLSAENWEGIGCEFRKYTNLSNGGGRKRRYVSKNEDES